MPARIPVRSVRLVIAKASGPYALGRLWRIYGIAALLRHGDTAPMTEDEIRRTAAMVQAVVDLHKRVPADYGGDGFQCEHCVTLCHSHSGLMCDHPYDGAWPCATIAAMATAIA